MMRAGKKRSVTLLKKRSALVLFFALFSMQGLAAKDQKNPEYIRLYLGAGAGAYTPMFGNRLFKDDLDGVMIASPLGAHKETNSFGRSVRASFEYLKGPWMVFFDGNAVAAVSSHTGVRVQDVSSAQSAEWVQARHERWNTNLIGGYDPFRWPTSSLYFLVGYDLTGSYSRLDRKRVSGEEFAGGRNDRLDAFHTGRLLGMSFRQRLRHLDVQVQYLYQYSPYGKWEGDRSTVFSSGTMETIVQRGPMRTDGHRLLIVADLPLNQAWAIRLQYTAGMTNLFTQRLKAYWTGSTRFQLDRFIANVLLAERTGLYTEQYQLVEVGFVATLEL